jgi:hypothetical protein
VTVSHVVSNCREGRFFTHSCSFILFSRLPAQISDEEGGGEGGGLGIGSEILCVMPRLEGLERNEEMERLTEAEKKKLAASREKDEQLWVKNKLLLAKEQKVDVSDGECVPLSC